ncbi:cytochrome c biogenesis protein CcdA [uncultured Mucilaginibacter sp.]|uniref:protein-disulfide reductase DsbD family protein n=1 Tax=uncultured Mucilaginibacter sp. TaxID=797541 RepID=UPI0025D80A6D|nr:cytochrome c biogenesis protein CcdA [uncultured Mucilaginibacter sp.]
MQFTKALLFYAAMLFTLLVITRPANAQDTVSTNDIEFTNVEPVRPSSLKKSLVAKPNAKAPSALQAKANATGQNQTLWALFGAGFLWGLAAIFMPCIFPMLPFTVSYFTKKAQSRAKGIRMALMYGLSIIVIYVVLGLAITLLFGADTLNSMATNGVFNLVFFALLISFAASFLGAFEITLPSSWANKMDEKSDRGGYLGIFFMAATLALVSFSCTGPLIGTLLVQAAVSGAILAPAAGMLGFSLALAIPFTLFAIFPSMLQTLPKSGGWLNSVKVVLGFLELALALKFLSNVDLAYHWHMLDREVFLVLWIIIFTLLGFYLLGKLQFSHDSILQYLSIPRLFIAILTLSFALYMVPGLWGAPLKSISAFLPPQGTQDFDLYTSTLTNSKPATTDTITRKYAKLFEKPAGQNPFFDYEQGLVYAKTVNKPVILDFTGHACVNCRKMEADVWTDRNVLPVIRDDYVLIQLYVDDKTELPLNQQYVSSFSGKKITTIGSLNSDFQASRFGSNSQPFYILLNPSTQKALVESQGAIYNIPEYIQFLQSGLRAYHTK